jgi:leader peptidase (prepilin peptidase)/N-methyltransferase
MGNILLYIPLAFGGYLIGAAVNVITDRLYVYRQVWPPAAAAAIRSRGWWLYGLIPTKTTGVEAKFFRRSLIVLLVFTVFGPGLLSRPDLGMDWWLAVPVLIYFGVVVVMDVEYRVVMNQVSLAGVVLGLATGMILRGVWETMLGGIVGYSVMFLLFKLGEWFMRIVNRRKQEPVDEVALGYGDVNLAGVCGLFLGWPPIFLGLLFAILAGGLAGVLVITVSVVLRRYRAYAVMPYAPFLAFATLVMLLFPAQIVQVLSL